MHSSIKARFFSSIDAGRAPHACFISCADASIALEVARQAAARFCHVENVADSPDILQPTLPMPIKEMRELLSEFSKRPFLDKGRAVVLENAHTMDPNVQNVLLKTLEEPPAGTIFLLTGKLSAMLPTIRSRCAVLRLDELSLQEIATELRAQGANQSEARLWAAAGGGSLPESLRLYQQADYRALRKEALELLRSVLKGALPYDLARKYAKEKTAASIVHFWLSFCGDMLRAKCMASSAQNPDLTVELGNMAKDFTTGTIACMIELLGAAMRRLETNASAALTLCRLFLDMQEASEH